MKLCAILALAMICPPPESRFEDASGMMQGWHNSSQECLGFVRAYGMELIRLERFNHPLLSDPERFYVECMGRKGLVF